MNLKVEHAIIAVLVLALLYYVYSHQSLLSDLRFVPHQGNPQLKAVKEKHDFHNCRYTDGQTLKCLDDNENLVRVGASR